MDRQTRNAALAAALILVFFGVIGYYMPAIMVWLGGLSPYAGGVAAALFVMAFFGIFWQRGRSQRRRPRE
jgi:membrane protein implicated in regulation of membrane protease activity